MENTVERVRMLDSGFESRPLVILNSGASSCGADFCVERKTMSFNAAEFVQDGEGWLETGGEVYHIKKNDVFFLKHSCAHKYYADKNNPWKKIFVSFYGPAADSLTDCCLNQLSPVYCNCGFLKDSFLKILETAFSEKSCGFIQYECAAEVFKILYSVQLGKLAEADLADKIKNLIDSNLQNDFSLDFLCGALNYSKNHILKVFSAKYGISPYSYYLKARIRLAEKYLAFTSVPLGEIARILNYSDFAYFSYSFKKAAGVSPSEYRKNSLG